MQEQQWNPELYAGRHSFVWERARDLFNWLDPRPGERILDAGCGTGQLTAAIAETGAEAVGIDFSPEMIEQASAAYPNIPFLQADLTDYSTDRPFDAVFSNATLHWIPKAREASAAIHGALRPGGRFVFEMGGAGNIGIILKGIAHAFDRLGLSFESPDRILYFPSVAQQAAVLEEAGFVIRRVAYFDRPTPLEEGEAGLRNWVTMFKTSYVRQVPETLRERFFGLVEEYCRPFLYEAGQYSADYKRLRMMAIRSS